MINLDFNLELIRILNEKVLSIEEWVVLNLINGKEQDFMDEYDNILTIQSLVRKGYVVLSTSEEDTQLFILSDKGLDLLIELT